MEAHAATTRRQFAVTTRRNAWRRPGEVDGRSRAGRFIKAKIKALSAKIGGARTAAQKSVIAHVAELAWQAHAALRDPAASRDDVVRLCRLARLAEGDLLTMRREPASGASSDFGRAP